MTTEKVNSKTIKIMSFFHSPQCLFNILHRRKKKEKEYKGTILYKMHIIEW